MASGALRKSLGYLDFTFPGVEANLALDEALLSDAEEGGPSWVLRLWESLRFAVVLGASGRVAEDVHGEACRQDGVAVFRRASGGGTVVIGPGALNATVVLPLDAAPGLSAVDRAQNFVLERFAAALRQAGAPVAVLGSGDLTLDRRKFAGSAQRRLRCHFLVHVSILYDFPLDRIARYTALPRRQPAYREGRSHDHFVTNLGLPREVLAGALRSAWRAGAEGPMHVGVPFGRVAELVQSRYADPAWIHRF